QSEFRRQQLPTRIRWANVGWPIGNKRRLRTTKRSQSDDPARAESIYRNDGASIHDPDFGSNTSDDLLVPAHAIPMTRCSRVRAVSSPHLQRTLRIPIA